MKKILVAYATREGHTRSIATYFAQALRARGVEVDTGDVASPPTSIAVGSYAFVVLAASLHMAKFEPEMVTFATAYRAALEAVPNLFLAVCNTAGVLENPHATDEARKKARSDIDETVRAFESASGFHPARTEPVAGAILYREYNVLVRFVMKRISKKEGGPTDTSRDWVLTNWDSLDHLAEAITVAIGVRPAGTSAPPPVQPGIR